MVVLSAKSKKVKILNMIVKKSVLPAGFDCKVLIGNKLDDLVLGRLLSTEKLLNINN